MSIVQIAKITGVSHSTVSRVINGYPNVNAETVKTVRAAMRKIGYTPPDPKHRPGPRTRLHNGIRWGTILVGWNEIPTELVATNFSQAVDGIIVALQENGLTPVFCHAGKTERLPSCIIKEQVDGCVMIAGEPQGILAEKLKNVPVICMSSRRTQSGDHIIGGNETVGQLAAEYLISRGSEHLCFLNPLPSNPANKARGKGFSFAAHQKNITVKNYIGDETDQKPGYAYSLKDLEALTAPLIDAVIKKSRFPIGLFLPQDMITAVAYRLFNRLGIRPGKNIDIVSANNEAPYLAGLHPRPATIDIGSRVNGRHAVEQLLWRLRHPEENRVVRVIIEPVLVPGDEKD